MQFSGTFTFCRQHLHTIVMALLASEFPFLVPLHPERGLSPRRSVQLVDAPPGKGSKFVFDPTGAVAAFLSRVSLPLKVIGVAGAFRSVSASPH